MRLFDEVAICTDQSQMEWADALRSMLESFRLRVHFHRLIQRAQVLELFGRGGPECEWTVLMSHGFTNDGDFGIRFGVVDNPSGDPRIVNGWHAATVDFTPQTIPVLLTNAHGTVITGSCGGGREELARAFLAAGYDAYVGCPHYVDGSATVLFISGLFYFLLAEDRDLAPRSYSLQEAVRRAAGFDPGWKHGTEEFVCYTAEETPREA